MKIKKENTLEKKLLEIGAAKLRRFGFVNVSIDNIMQDEVYRCFFEKILEDEVGKNSMDDAVINKLLREIETTKNLKRKITAAIK